MSGSSLYDLGFGDKQYKLQKNSEHFFLYDTRRDQKCLQINEETASRILILLNIQVLKNYNSPDGESCQEIYRSANCHGTALYVLGWSSKEDFKKLDVDGDIFVYDEWKDQKDSFESTFLVPKTKEISIPMPIGIHYTDVFQRHSAVLLGEDQVDKQYYVSFQKIGYHDPWVLASFRKEILDLRNDILLIPNGLTKLTG